MKQLSRIVLLLLLSCHLLQAQLDKELQNLSQQLYKLEVTLKTQIFPPLPPVPEPPKPELVQPVIETWEQLVAENNRRKTENMNKADLTIFNARLEITVNKYPDIITLQQAFQNENPELVNKFTLSTGSCGYWQPENEMHFTLLYLKIPLETKKISTIANKPDFVGFRDQLKTILEKDIKDVAPAIQNISFEYAEQNKVIGAKENEKYLAALFTPSEEIAVIREKLTLPFAKTLFAQYPFAWIDYLENPDYHISLAILKNECVKEPIKNPDPLPPVTMFNFATGILKVSVSVYGAKGSVTSIITW